MKTYHQLQLPFTSAKLGALHSFKSWFTTNKAIVFNAGSLFATNIVTSGLGFVYWWVAARLFTQAEVGLASAAISAMMLLGTIGMLGLGTILIGQLPGQREKAGELIVTALLMAGPVAAILGAGYALLAPRLSNELVPLATNIESIGLFSAGVAISAVVMVLDQALIGLLRGGLQLGRNVLFALTKLGLVTLVGLTFTTKGGLIIYFTWFAGNLLSLLGLTAFVLRGKLVIKNHRPDWSFLRGLGKKALGHHTLNLATQAPGLILPTLVTVLLSSSVNASFYVAWMIATFAFMVPTSLTTVLYAVGAAKPALLAQKMGFTLKVSVLAGVLGTLLIFWGAEIFLNLFGASYAKGAANALRIVVIGVFPLTIKVHFVAISQVYNRITSAAKLVLLGCLLELLGAILGANLAGLPGLCLGWVIALSLEAIILAPSVYTTLTNAKSKIEQNTTPKLLALPSPSPTLKLLVGPELVSLPRYRIALPQRIELSFPSGKEILVAGRQPCNDLVLPFLSISRQHATFRLSSEGLVVCDLGSTNGTFINKIQLPLGEEHLVKPGDELQIGKVLLKLELSSTLQSSMTVLQPSSSSKAIVKRNNFSSSRPLWLGKILLIKVLPVLLSSVLSVLLWLSGYLQIVTSVGVIGLLALLGLLELLNGVRLKLLFRVTYWLNPLILGVFIFTLTNILINLISIER